MRVNNVKEDQPSTSKTSISSSRRSRWGPPLPISTGNINTPPPGIVHHVPGFQKPSEAPSLMNIKPNLVPLAPNFYPPPRFHSNSSSGWSYDSYTASHPPPVPRYYINGPYHRPLHSYGPNNAYPVNGVSTAQYSLGRSTHPQSIRPQASGFFESHPRLNPPPTSRFYENGYDYSSNRNSTYPSSQPLPSNIAATPRHIEIPEGPVNSHTQIKLSPGSQHPCASNDMFRDPQAPRYRENDNALVDSGMPPSTSRYSENRSDNNTYQSSQPSTSATNPQMSWHQESPDSSVRRRTTSNSNPANNVPCNSENRASSCSSNKYGSTSGASKNYRKVKIENSDDIEPSPASNHHRRRTTSGSNLPSLVSAASRSSSQAENRASSSGSNLAISRNHDTTPPKIKIEEPDEPEVSQEPSLKRQKSITTTTEMAARLKRKNSSNNLIAKRIKREAPLNDQSSTSSSSEDEEAGVHLPPQKHIRSKGNTKEVLRPKSTIIDDESERDSGEDSASSSEAEKGLPAKIVAALKSSPKTKKKQTVIDDESENEGTPGSPENPQLLERKLFHHFKVSSYSQLLKLNDMLPTRPSHIPKEFSNFREMALKYLKRTITEAPRGKTMYFLYMASMSSQLTQLLDPKAPEVCKLCKESFTLQHLLSPPHIRLYQAKYNKDPPQISKIFDLKNHKIFMNDIPRTVPILKQFRVESFEALRLHPAFTLNRYYDEDSFEAYKNAFFQRLESYNLTVDPKVFTLEKLLFLRSKVFEQNQELMEQLEEVFVIYPEKCVECDVMFDSWKEYLHHTLSKKHIKKALTQLDLHHINKALNLLVTSLKGYSVKICHNQGSTSRARSQSSTSTTTTNVSTSLSEEEDNLKDEEEEEKRRLKERIRKLEEQLQFRHRLAKLKSFKKLTSKQAQEKEELKAKLANLESDYQRNYNSSSL